MSGFVFLLGARPRALWEQPRMWLRPGEPAGRNLWRPERRSGKPSLSVPAGPASSVRTLHRGAGLAEGS